MRRFKVVDSTHYHGKVAYQRGQVVESEEDLAKMFPNKFVLLSSRNEEVEDEEGDKPRANKPVPMPPMPGKPTAKAAPAADSEEEGDDAPTPADAKETKEEADDEGTDVTEEFAAAAKKKLTVMEVSKGKFTVKDDKGESLTVVPLDEKKLRKLIADHGK